MNMNIKPLISSSLQTNFLSQFLTSPVSSTNTKSEFTLSGYLTNDINRVKDADNEDNNLNNNLNSNIERKNLKNNLNENKLKKAPSGSVMTFRKSMNSLTSIGFYSSLTSDNNINKINNTNTNRIRNAKEQNKKINLSYNKTSTSNNYKTINPESGVNSKSKFNAKDKAKDKAKDNNLNNNTSRIGSGVGVDITMSLPTIGMHGIKNLVSPKGKKMIINSNQIILPPKSPVRIYK